MFGTEEAERRVEETRGVGEIHLFAFQSLGGSPYEWHGSDEVVFLTRDGTATVDLTTGTVMETNSTIASSEQPPPPVPGRELTPGTRYGPWEVTGDARFLVADESGDIACGLPLVSPDGTYVACSYMLTDRAAESTETQPAVIRLR
jgi:hypothetical protein